MPEVDVFTSGDHTWDQKTFEQEIRDIPNLVRPANFSRLQPGVGWRKFRNPAGGEIAVISLLGKVFMKESAYCPFETAEEIVKQLPLSCKCIIVDIHAEATSEKAALAWMLDGRVTAVIGTHTHVQTNDARILPNGTAFLTDAGMVGASDSILGREVDAVVRKFRTGMPQRERKCAASQPASPAPTTVTFSCISFKNASAIACALRLFPLIGNPVALLFRYLFPLCVHETEM